MTPETRMTNGIQRALDEADRLMLGIVAVGAACIWTFALAEVLL